MQFWQVSGKGEMVKFVAGMWEAVPIWAVDIHTRRAGPPSDPHSSTASLCLGFSVCQGGKVTLTLFWKVMWQAQSIRQLWEALRDLLELQIQKQGKILSAGCKDLKKKDILTCYCCWSPLPGEVWRGHFSVPTLYLNSSACLNPNPAQQRLILLC